MKTLRKEGQQKDSRRRQQRKPKKKKNIIELRSDKWIKKGKEQGWQALAEEWKYRVFQT